MVNVLSPRKRKAAIAKAVATKKAKKEDAAREAAMASSGSAWLETSVQTERAEIDKHLSDASPQTIYIGPGLDAEIFLARGDSQGPGQGGGCTNQGVESEEREG
eukprot:2484191-Amphidinium_carterae.1